jgi:hypothetical protein
MQHGCNFEKVSSEAVRRFAKLILGLVFQKALASYVSGLPLVSSARCFAVLKSCHVFHGHSCRRGWWAEKDMNDLVNLCLFTVNRGKLEMHDQLRDLGRRLEECGEGLEGLLPWAKRKRLWELQSDGMVGHS